MRLSSLTTRLQGLGGAKWDLHLEARRRIDAGEDIIEMTIGEPDVALPAQLAEVAIASLRAGRTGYSSGEGEPGLRRALAARYSARSGREIGRDQILCFPGTQTALFTVLQGVAETGDAVLVGDPMYATYEGVIRATGAEMIPVPLRAEHGFRLQARDLAARLTPSCRAILLNTPHNPSGAVLRADDIREIAALARAHDLWIICDEVYEALIFGDQPFASPLSLPEVADRVIVVSSISKSHAAPGLRSGWAIGPAAFCAALLPVSETMLFGNQPFIADLTEAAVRQGSPVADEMRERFAARAARLAARLEAETDLRVVAPEAGMFALVEVATDGERFAFDLLRRAGVAVMPGASFGAGLGDWIRLSLTVADRDFDRAVARIIDHVGGDAHCIWEPAAPK